MGGIRDVMACVILAGKENLGFVGEKVLLAFDQVLLLTRVLGLLNQ